MDINKTVAALHNNSKTQIKIYTEVKIYTEGISQMQN